MNINDTHSCPSCGTLHVVALNLTSLLICKNCHEIVQTSPTAENAIRTRIPEDWSFLRIGSTGEFDKQSFKIIGRVRLQLRNDYKNFWTAVYGRGECLWLVESFGSFSAFTSPWRDYEKDASKLRADALVSLPNDVKLTGDYVEKCEGISFEGEIGPWKSFFPGFFVVQASENNQTALFLVNKGQVEYLIGKTVLADTLKFQNIITWNEWK